MFSYYHYYLRETRLSRDILAFLFSTTFPLLQYRLAGMVSLELYLGRGQVRESINPPEAELEQTLSRSLRFWPKSLYSLLPPKLYYKDSRRIYCHKKLVLSLSHSLLAQSRLLTTLEHTCAPRFFADTCHPGQNRHLIFLSFFFSILFPRTHVYKVYNANSRKIYIGTHNSNSVNSAQ